MIGNLIIAVIGYGAATTCAVFSVASIVLGIRAADMNTEGSRRLCRRAGASALTLTVLALVFATATKLVTAL